MAPLCVLDFFVPDNVQRKGYGKRIFDHMLSMENIQPAHLAIDKPSEKSIRFLNKHYNLKNPIGQVNNFVVFDGFFDNRPDLLLKQRKNTNLYQTSQNRKNDVFSAKPLVYASNRINSLPPLPNSNNISNSANLDSNKQSLNRTQSVDSKLNNNRYYDQV